MLIPDSTLGIIPETIPEAIEPMFVELDDGIYVESADETAASSSPCMFDCTFWYAIDDMLLIVCWVMIVPMLGCRAEVRLPCNSEDNVEATEDAISVDA